MVKNISGDGRSFPRQYILCRDRLNIPSTWAVKQLKSWYLGHDSALPIVDIQDRANQTIGWLVGYPIDGQGKLGNRLQLTFDAPAKNFTQQFETAMAEYGGRYVAILLSSTASRLYLDPAGTLATVYCPSQEIVASSTTLIPYRSECGDNQALIDAIQPQKRDGWYPFGLTPRHGVSRLIPSHCLDLDSWQSQRYWSTAHITPTTDCDRSVAKIAAILTRQIKAIAKKYPIYLSLTAGRDSRMLLACSRSSLTRTKFFTREIPDSSARLDCEIATNLAERFDLDYRLLTYQNPSPTELEQWLLQTGNCVAGRVWQSVKTLKQLESDRIYLPGIAAEVGRCFYWRRQDTTEQEVSAIEILERMRMPQTPLLQQKAQQWLTQLPVKDRFAVLDLLYLEQRLGCWAGPLHYGLVNNGFCLSPFVNRRLLEIMLSLPVDYRQNQLFARDLIRQQWSELLTMPFNRYPGIQGQLLVLQQKIQNKLQKLGRR
ncbi:MAG: hypothetical protein AAFO95_17795 [Cyanobacteria bacterium J06600_6]